MVVFSRGDRIEFVIVTSGAVHGQSEECLTDRSDDVLQFVLAHHRAHSIDDRNNGVMGTRDNESDRLDRFSDVVGRRSGRQPTASEQQNSS